jgi:hypothetical protein
MKKSTWQYRIEGVREREKEKGDSSCAGTYTPGMCSSIYSDI